MVGQTEQRIPELFLLITLSLLEEGQAVSKLVVAVALVVF
jgi:hypothetical protein